MTRMAIATAHASSRANDDRERRPRTTTANDDGERRPRARTSPSPSPSPSQRPCATIGISRRTRARRIRIRMHINSIYCKNYTHTKHVCVCVPIHSVIYELQYTKRVSGVARIAPRARPKWLTSAAKAAGLPMTRVPGPRASISALARGFMS